MTPNPDAQLRQAERARLERLLWQTNHSRDRYENPDGSRSVWTGYEWRDIASLSDAEILAMLPVEARP